MTSLYWWQVGVDAPLIGAGPPSHVRVMSWGHTKLTPRGARHVLLFLRRGADGVVNLVNWRVLDIGDHPGSWNAQARTMATELGLPRCNARAE
jgi:hypothetical protein